MVRLDELFPNLKYLPEDSPEWPLLKGVSTTIGHIWAAALIDGEGCININKSGPYYRASVVVSNTSFELMKPLVALFGSKIIHERVMTDNHKQVWRWSTTNPVQTRDMLLAIRPFLITKKIQADVALQVCELLIAAPKIRDEFGSQYPDYIAVLESLKQRMHVLNARGPVKTPRAGSVIYPLLQGLGWRR